jgi:hypothetical protein
MSTEQEQTIYEFEGLGYEIIHKGALTVMAHKEDLNFLFVDAQGVAWDIDSLQQEQEEREPTQYIGIPHADDPLPLGAY